MIRLIKRTSKIPLNFFSYYEKIRNIGISAHIDSGKTTFTERVLFYSGKINSIHEVRGTDGVGATMDFMELERERGITIQSAATNLVWKDHQINLIDTPGHVDFTIEVERALRVLDGAVLIVCGVAGVQAQTYTVDKQMNRYSVPRIIFINKLDRVGGNAIKVLESIKLKLKLNTELVQLQIGLDSNFNGLVDLVEMKAYYFQGDSGKDMIEAEIPEDMREIAQERRTILLERLAENNDKLLMRLLDEEEITNEEIKQIIREQTIQRKFVPVFVGSAYKNKGVQSALDGVIDYLPNPSQIQNKAYQRFESSEGTKEQEFILQTDPKEQFVSLAFKLEENQFGQLTFCRAYQGRLKKGDTIYNVKDQKKVRVSRIVKLHANKIEDIEQVQAGDIYALFGVECASGTTFIKNEKEKLVSLNTMYIPDPVISVSIKPKNKNAIQNLQKAIQRFTREDPTFSFRIDPESEELILSGMGELHLQIYCERLKREYSVECIVGEPIVNYRETLSQPIKFNFLHKKQTGGAGQYARIIGEMKPLIDINENPSADIFNNQFKNEVIGQEIPFEYINAIEKQFYLSCDKGPMGGYPIINTQFILQSGETHPVDSSQMAFQNAVKNAIKDVFSKQGAVLMEPLMLVDVSVPYKNYQPIMNSLTQRGGSIFHTETQGDLFLMKAKVALSNMFGFTGEVRSFTQGQGEFTMEYLTHAPVPVDQQDLIVAKLKQMRRDNK